MGIVKQSLYQISEDFKSIDKMIEDGELTEEQVSDQIDALDMSFDKKAINVATIRNEIKLTSELVKTELNRLKSRKSALDNKAKWLGQYLQTSMQKAKKTNVKGELFDITLVKGAEYAEISNKDDISDEFVDVSVVEKVNEAALFAALKMQRDEMEKCKSEEKEYEGELIKGASINRRNPTIRVK